MIPWQLGMQGNAAMYSNAHVWMQTFDCCCREHKQAHLSLRVHPYKQGMLNTINMAELVALLIAMRHCRPGVKESIATDSKCSMQ